MLSEKNLKDIANVLRRDVLQMTTEAGSGHPTSCLSCAEIMAVLFFSKMRYTPNDPLNVNNDEFILSKGHAAPILYACLKRAGCIKDDLMTLRKLESNLEGHPIPNSIKWIKVATGSLGQGLSIGVGMALAQRFLGLNSAKTFVLVGDSEMTEGSNYEAMEISSKYKLKNLIAIVDCNRLGQRGETSSGWNFDVFLKKFEAFGWRTALVDGHDVHALISALEKIEELDRPFAIIAKTVKGKGVSFLEDKEGWHGKVLNREELKKALEEIPSTESTDIFLSSENKKEPKSKHVQAKVVIPKDIDWKKREFISTREAYGKALAKLVELNSNVMVLDAEVGNSTYALEAKKVRDKNFIECFVAEQNMIGMSLGLSKKGITVFASSFGSFLSRAHDQIRMAALSDGSFTICGSHAGVSVGEDGPSQMALEDIAMFRSLPKSIILYPSDCTSCEKLVYLAARESGIKYIRTTRGKTPIVYDKKEKFSIGDFKILKSSDRDKVVLVGAGITLHEVLKAYEKLSIKKINCAVVDLFCIKPFNYKKFIKFVKKHGGKIVVSEDHYEEGGIGEMLSSVVAGKNIEIEILAIREKPHSGTPQELLRKYRIDAEAIIKATKRILKL